MFDKEASFLARVPWHIVLVTMLIMALSCVNLASAAQATRPNLWLVQLIWFGAAFVFATIIARTRTYWIEASAYPIYGFVCLLLVVVIVAGTKVKGAQRWIDLGVFMLQPSELAKVAILLVTARYFSRYQKEGGYTLRDLIMPMNLTRPIGVMAVLVLRWVKQASDGEALDPTWLKVTAISIAATWLAGAIFVFFRTKRTPQRLIAPADIIILPFALILIEPDLGTSLIVIAIAAVQVLFVGVSKVSLVIATTIVIITAVFGWNFLLKEYQKDRVETFLNPEADVQGAGYHSTQSMIAIGSGGASGKGHGEGTQTQLRFLPENQTDFVFSVVAEEWGLVGGVTIIGLFMTLILLMIREGRFATSRFHALLAIGGAAMLFWHVIINIGMVTGLMPVVGVTLPFMSYGGSSVLTQTLAIALCINASMWRRGA